MLKKINHDSFGWLVVAFIAKLLLGLYLVYSITGLFPHYNTFYIKAADTFSYLDCIDNLIQYGSYNPFYRMPGVGVVYYFLRQLFDIDLARTLLVMIQIFLDAYACFALSKLIYQIMQNKVAFLITFFLTVSSSYYSLYNVWLMSESICTSTLVLSVYYFYQGINREKNKNSNFLFSGFFLTWAIFCRPIYVPLIALYVLGILYYSFRLKPIQIIKYVFIFLFPFLFFDSLWVYAGYKHTGKFYPLQHSDYEFTKESKEYTEAYITHDWKLSLFKYVQAFGGDIVDWNPDSDISWFNTNKSVKSKLQELPKYAYSKTITLDSLLEVKNNIILINSTKDPKQIDSLSNFIDTKLMRYTEIYKNEKPIHYHLLSRIIIFKKLIVQNATYNLYGKSFSELKLYEKGVKILYLLLYYMYIVGAILSLIFIIKDRKLRQFLPIILVAAYGLAIYPFLRLCEFRYIVPAMPFVLLLCAYTLFSIYNVIFNGKNTLSRP